MKGGFAVGSLLVGHHSFPFDDRTLAHIRVAFAIQLSEGNAFFFSWHRTPKEGSGNISLWVSPTETIVFEFVGSREPRINKDWIHAILTSRGGGNGLKLLPEPATTEAPHRTPDAA